MEGGSAKFNSTTWRHQPEDEYSRTRIESKLWWADGKYVRFTAIFGGSLKACNKITFTSSQQKWLVNAELTTSSPNILRSCRNYVLSVALQRLAYLGGHLIDSRLEIGRVMRVREWRPFLFLPTIAVTETPYRLCQFPPYTSIFPPFSLARFLEPIQSSRS
jgi:hypothetical protein